VSGVNRVLAVGHGRVTRKRRGVTDERSSSGGVADGHTWPPRAYVRTFVLFSAVLLLAIPVDAADATASSPPPPRCKGSTNLVGECFRLRGRLWAGNGNPTRRIWRVGTKRILGVSEEHRLPGRLESLVTWSLDGRVYGDFEVCPLENARPGNMQLVCVESGERLVLERYEESGTTVQRLLWSWRKPEAVR
jgi:hypothetical protein